MTVKSSDLINGVAAPRRPAYRGVIPGAAIERTLITAIQVAAWLLVLLSILGTFYGARGIDAPLTRPIQIVLDCIAAPSAFGLALVAQITLAVAQWGGRRLARRDPRWWLIYLGSLSLSVWWNWTAYGDPLITLGVPWLAAIGVVAAADIAPELALIQE